MTCTAALCCTAAQDAKAIALDEMMHDDDMVMHVQQAAKQTAGTGQYDVAGRDARCGLPACPALPACLPACVCLSALAAHCAAPLLQACLNPWPLLPAYL